jgi:hypothetical protein
LNLSEFVADTAGPHLGHTEHFERGLFGDATFYESHDFSADDRLIMFSGNLAPGQHQTYFDIYTIDVLTHDLNRLTFTTENVWDEHAHFQPNSGKIVWICSQGYSFVPEIWALTMRTEYWLMNPDGTDKRRLTYFNDSAHTEYTGARVIVADCSWSPAGDRLIALSLYDDGQTTWGKVFMVEFADTPVEEVESPRLPYDDLLDQNYPNPFNSQTAIGYHLPEEGSVVLDIYNIAGQRVRTLVNRRQAAGMHAVIWDGRDDLGAPIGSGVYLYRLQIDQSCCPSKKMILLR